MSNAPEHDQSTNSVGDDGDAMTLSEERLELSTEWFISGRIRLHRRVVTETRLVEISVRREELVVETDDVTTAGDSFLGLVTDSDAVPAPAREHPPIVLLLREEVPIVTTTVQPYERVVATTSVVAGIASVDDSVRHEEYALDQPRTGNAGTTPRNPV